MAWIGPILLIGDFLYQFLNLKKSMTRFYFSSFFILFFALISLLSCESMSNKTTVATTNKISPEVNKKNFEQALQKHLDAVASRDLESLASTMSPDGKMQLILPGAEIFEGVSSFMDYHREWFQDTSWTFETKILNSEVGEQIGMAVTEITYREPERNGAPYFNRMIVSYALEKVDDKWSIILDHCSSVEKSTDKK